MCVGEHGKLLVLDYAPMKNTSRLLEVKLHVPAEVKILGEFLVPSQWYTWAVLLMYVNLHQGFR